MCIGLTEACAYLGVPDQVNGTSNIGNQSVCKSIIAVDLGQMYKQLFFNHHLSHFVSSSLFPLQVGKKKRLFIRYPQHSRTTLLSCFSIPVCDFPSIICISALKTIKKNKHFKRRFYCPVVLCLVTNNFNHFNFQFKMKERDIFNERYVNILSQRCI